MDENTLLRAQVIRDFNRFYTNIIGHGNQTILDSPYSLAEVQVLLEIERNDQCTASNLVKNLKIDPGYLSRMLTHFEENQLVVKSRSSSDGRAHFISLTAKGNEAVRKLSYASINQIAKLLENIPEGEQVNLVRYMRAIKAILSNQSITANAGLSKEVGQA